MKQLPDRFFLGLPVLFLKQYPYAWITVIAVWPRTWSVAAVFLPFQEISCIARTTYQASRDVPLMARTPDAADGLLPIPRDPRVFSKRLNKLFIVPADLEIFMEQSPYGFGNAN